MKEFCSLFFIQQVVFLRIKTQQAYKKMRSFIGNIAEQYLRPPILAKRKILIDYQLNIKIEIINHQKICTV